MLVRGAREARRGEKRGSLSHRKICQFGPRAMPSLTWPCTPPKKFFSTLNRILICNSPCSNCNKVPRCSSCTFLNSRSDCVAAGITLIMSLSFHHCCLQIFSIWLFPNKKNQFFPPMILHILSFDFLFLPPHIRFIIFPFWKLQITDKRQINPSIISTKNIDGDNFMKSKWLIYCDG